MKTYISINQGCEYPYASRVFYHKSLPKWKNSKYKMKTMIKIPKSNKFNKKLYKLIYYEDMKPKFIFSISTKYVIDFFLISSKHKVKQAE